MSEFKDRYTYDSKTVALYIVAWANDNKVTINLTKTQKLLYIAYGANMVFKSDRLCNEHPQAWPYGPVFPITRRLLLKRDLSAINLKDSAFTDMPGKEYLSNLMDFVFRGFGNMTAGQLTAWSHRPGSAWDETTRMNGFKWGNQIPDAFILERFKGMITFQNA